MTAPISANTEVACFTVNLLEFCRILDRASFRTFAKLITTAVASVSDSARGRR